MNQAPTMPNPTTIDRILIVRPDNLGDFVLFSGTLKKIRSHWKQAEITLCVKDYVVNYVELCPFVDRVISWEKTLHLLLKSGYARKFIDPAERFISRKSAALADFAFNLLINSGLEYDIILFPVRSPDWTHHLFVRSVKARAKFGISGDYCNQTPENDDSARRFYTRRLTIPAEDRWKHEFHIHEEFLRFLGIETEQHELWPEIWTDSTDQAWSEKNMPTTTLDGTFTIAICPGGNEPKNKACPTDKLAGAVGNLTDVKISCVIFGAHGDLHISRDLEEALGRFPNVSIGANFTGSTTIRQVAEAMKHCDIVLASETGALHIATALRKPTVGILGGGHFGRFYPWGSPDINRVVTNRLDCFRCGWRCIHDDGFRCVQGIPVHSITNELKHLISRFKHP